MSRVALVTGGSRGIGLAIARRLVEDGLTVCVVDVNEKALARLEGAGLDAERFQSRHVSVLDRDAMGRVMEELVAHHGSLDVLVNNAGMTRAGTLLTQTDEDWDLVIDTNLKGPFVCSQLAARHMKAGGGGAIVNIGSVSAHGIRSGPPAYAAAKAGLEGLTRNAAIELGRDGIRVNLIVLGTIESEWLLQRKTADELEEMRSSTLTGRLGRPEDVASVVSFLVSENAGHVTGQLFSVSGGQWLP
ncbi:MAG: SDR family oxidoreductase [Deltaproteobacteria bacterium]|nr:SDR family oxidoreductase [Deltaproteobacteria bacterium]